MGNKKTQKIFYYSTLEKKHFIENRIEDIARQTQHSASYIIEDTLLNGLLPKNDLARHIIQNHLYTRQVNHINNTLAALFSINSAGINWRSKYDNFKPFVEFCIYNLENAENDNIHDTEMSHFKKQLEAILSYISIFIDSSNNPLEKDFYVSQIKKAEHLLNETDQEILTKDFLYIINDCWDILKDYTYTYRSLTSFVNMFKIQENVYTRTKLFNIICEASEQW